MTKPLGTAAAAVVSEDTGSAVASRVAVVVLGMHRSGTSGVARALSLAGAALPQRLLGPGEDNPDGFFEPTFVVALNDQLLAALGQDWKSVGPIPPSEFERHDIAELRHLACEVLREDYGDASLFVIKDPRMARLMPFWDPVLLSVGAEPCYVCPIRHPLEVARSLERRNGLDQTQSLLMWLDHMISAEAASRGARRVFVRYNDFVARPAACIEAVMRELGILEGPLAPVALAAVDAAIKPSLYHHRLPAAALDLAARSAALAQRVYKVIGLSAGTEMPQDIATAWAQLASMSASAELTPYTTKAASETVGGRPQRPLAALHERERAVSAGLEDAACLLETAQELVFQLRMRAPSVSDNRPEALHEGYLDKVVGSVLHGWCWKAGTAERARLSLEVNGKTIGPFVASLPRQDLLASNIGDGRHGFSIDLACLGATEESVIGVRTDDGQFTLHGSGRTLGELRAE